ncbi:MAG: hypothetical protein AB1540_13555 [Bdellovibrionota bacterium]
MGPQTQYELEVEVLEVLAGELKAKKIVLADEQSCPFGLESMAIGSQWVFLLPYTKYGEFFVVSSCGTQALDFDPTSKLVYGPIDDKGLQSLPYKALKEKIARINSKNPVVEHEKLARNTSIQCSFEGSSSDGDQFHSEPFSLSTERQAEPLKREIKGCRLESDSQFTPPVTPVPGVPSIPVHDLEISPAVPSDEDPRFEPRRQRCSGESSLSAALELYYQPNYYEYAEPSIKMSLQIKDAISQTLLNTSSEDRILLREGSFKEPVLWVNASFLRGKEKVEVTANLRCEYIVAPQPSNK